MGHTLCLDRVRVRQVDTPLFLDMSIISKGLDAYFSCVGGMSGRNALGWILVLPGIKSKASGHSLLPFLVSQEL